MDLINALQMASSWLVLLAISITLCTAIALPRIREKVWFVSCLFLLFVQSAYFNGLNFYVRYFVEEKIAETYERFAWLTLLASYLIFIAFLLLAVGLFRFRLLVHSAREISKSNVQSSPNAAVERFCKATGGTALGPFRVERKRTLALARSATLSMRTDGSVSFHARYDPFGSALLAWLVTIICLVLLTAFLTSIRPVYTFTILSSLVFITAPLWWLLWYVIFVLVRRRPVTLELADADRIIVDAESSRIAFRTIFEGRLRWIACGIPDDFQSVAKAFDQVCAEKISTESVKYASILPFVFWILLVACILGYIVARH